MRVRKPPITDRRKVRSWKSDGGLHAPGVPAVGGEGGERESDDQTDIGGRHRVPAEDLQRIREQGDAAAEEHEAGIVHRVDLLVLIIRHEAAAHHKPEQGDGQVDEENHPPAHPVHDHTAEKRADHRADQGRDDHVVHGAQQLRPGKGAHEGDARDGRHHGAADALDDPGNHQHGHIDRQAAQQRTQGEDRDGLDEDALGAEPVGHPTADRDEHREGEGIAGQDGLEGEGGHAEIGGHDWDGGVEHRRVQILHKQRDGHEPRQEALSLGGRRLGHGEMTMGKSLGINFRAKLVRDRIGTGKN